MSTPIKPPEVSSITQEENEDIHNRLSKLEEQLIELSNMSNNWVKSQRKIQEMKKNMDDMKINMDENKEEIQKAMSFIILQDLDERIPKGDRKMPGTHENKGSIHVEQPTDNKQYSSGMNSNSGVNYGGGLKFNFPKI